MSEEGSDSEDGRESPIFGFSYDEEGNAHSFWAIDPSVTVEPESDTTENTDPLTKKSYNELSPPPKGFIGFTTAAGKRVPISEKALEAAKKKMESDTCETAGPLKERIPQDLLAPPQNVGFTTASGKTIAISEKALQAAKKKMESDTFENDGSSVERTSQEPLTPPVSVGFTTASGKTIAISEKALQAAKKKMELDTSENDCTSMEKSSQELMPPPPPPKFVQFSTASGKTISVSDKAMEEAEKKMAFDAFNNEGNIGPVPCTSNVFDFGNQSCLSRAESDEIEDLTRSLLEDISASNEFDWAVEQDMQRNPQPVNPVTEPEKQADPEVEAQKARTSTKRRILEQYGEPPDLPRLCTPAKRGRLTKKFAPPRPADPK